MDDVSLHQEDSGNDATANQTEDNKNNQTKREASAQECDPPKRDHLAEDTVEGHVVKSGANTEKAPEQAAGASIGNVEESQPVTDAIEVNSEEACKGEGMSQGADTGETEDPKVVNGEKKGEGEKEEEEDKNRKGQEVVKNGEIEKEDMKEDKKKGGENIARKKGKGEKIGEGKTEEKIKGDKGKDRKVKAGKEEGEKGEAGTREAGKGEAGKGEAGKGEAGKEEGEKGEAGTGKAGKGEGRERGEGEGEVGKAPENKSKPVKEKEGAGGGKVKAKSKEVEKQGKTKRKSAVNHTASTPSSVARPRSSARSARPSTKKDIIAKFQKNDSETPVVRNFKLQRSSMAVANGASIKQKVLSWCQNKTRKYEGVSIENFSSSWCDGLAFCALIHRFFPDAFDFSALSSSEREKNFTLAFNTAETMADCCPLLEVGDMILMGNSPDPMCVFTYVQALCHHLSKIEKERKDKEEEEKKGEKMKDEEVETTTEKKEEESEETGKIDGQQEGGDEGREKESEESSAVEKEQEEREVRGLIEAQA
ncbi:smoothelin-like protein 1 [Salvelinus fontinalis]|uniref:smoothelin-like protein 1 n=1 Tax=Salvelinus fontinalis TaxID=8038 RepID=UPI0024868542|nr:smoothelin-like protein 1 [Salvelinus fontinalis]